MSTFDPQVVIPMGLDFAYNPRELLRYYKNSQPIVELNASNTIDGTDIGQGWVTMGNSEYEHLTPV